MLPDTNDNLPALDMGMLVHAAAYATSSDGPLHEAYTPAHFVQAAAAGVASEAQAYAKQVIKRKALQTTTAFIQAVQCCSIASKEPHFRTAEQRSPIFDNQPQAC